MVNVRIDKEMIKIVMNRSWAENVKLFSCSTQLRSKFYPANKCQNANIVGFLTFIGRINGLALMLTLKISFT